MTPSDLLEFCLVEGLWIDWKISNFEIPRPKDCSNYQTIALLGHASKILLIILLNRLRQKFEDELPDEQAGFRRGRGTADMLCCIQNVIEKTLLMSERTFIVFIDCSKAFDNVSHIQMFNILNDMWFPRHIVALIQALYEKQSAMVRWNGSHTKPFFTEKGVRQGCILSPLLLCAYTEQVMTHERGWCNRIRRRYWRKIHLKLTVRRRRSTVR